MTEIHNDRGASAIMIAISAFVLMGIAALALDGGNLYQERRSTQNAADQAVVAAAYTDCVGDPDPVGAGLAAAAENGFDDADPDISVNVAPTGQPGQYEAEVHTDVDGAFAQTIGADDLGTGATALASCELGIGQVTALFAKATGCDDELTITLDDSTVTGGVHSNGTIFIPGDRPTIEGGVTYGVVHPDDGTDANPGNGIYDSGTPPHTYDPGPMQTVTDEDFPIEWNITDYAPGNFWQTELASTPGLYHSFTSSQTFKDETLEGIYYVDGNITLQENITVGPRGVTFVATGTIHGSENNQTFFHFDHPDNQKLLMFANHGAGGCDDSTAINISGDDVDLTGIVYAPNAKADVAGDGNDTVAIWGNFVEATGDGFDIDAPSLKGFGDPEITFDQ